MSLSECRLIKNSLEYIPADEIRSVPARTRGIYVLYKHNRRTGTFNVVYIGMARGEKTGIAGRLHSHRLSPLKRGQWTHFSAYEVWDNISKQEIEELEGLFRHLFRHDAKANALAKQKSYSPLRRLARRSKTCWIERFPA